MNHDQPIQMCDNPCGSLFTDQCHDCWREQNARWLQPIRDRRRSIFTPKCIIAAIVMGPRRPRLTRAICTIRSRVLIGWHSVEVYKSSRCGCEIQTSPTCPTVVITTCKYCCHKIYRPYNITQECSIISTLGPLITPKPIHSPHGVQLRACPLCERNVIGKRFCVVCDACRARHNDHARQIVLHFWLLCRVLNGDVIGLIYGHYLAFFAPHKKIMDSMFFVPSIYGDCPAPTNQSAPLILAATNL